VTAAAPESGLALTGPLLLVGAGKMGGAMLDRWLARGLDPAATIVLDPGIHEQLATHLQSIGAQVNPPDSDIPSPAIVVLAIKPQMLDAVLPEIRHHIGSHTLVVSILAGKPLAALEAGLPAGVAVVRAMPNTPAQIGRGITVGIANARVDGSQHPHADALLAATGEVVWIDDESLMDAVTAVSGSGPAYVFLLAETLAAAGVSAGLPPPLAERLARVTVSGSAELLQQSGIGADILRKNVTSPGGTTAAALEVLMASEGFPGLLEKAVAAATQRGKELVA